MGVGGSKATFNEHLNINVNKDENARINTMWSEFEREVDIVILTNSEQLDDQAIKDSYAHVLENLEGYRKGSHITVGKLELIDAAHQYIIEHVLKKTLAEQDLTAERFRIAKEILNRYMEIFPLSEKATQFINANLAKLKAEEANRRALNTRAPLRF